MRYISWVLSLCATAAAADPVDDVLAAANARFAFMPTLRMVDQILGNCGGSQETHDHVAYCTTAGEILITKAARALPQAPYLVAHALGHAVQVRHGVADVALATIRSNRAQESYLRTNVEQMVDCIAGVLVSQAGIAPTDLGDWFATDPFADAHWGRDPLSSGPVISVPLDMRQEWFDMGQGGFIGACATEAFGAELLLKAYRE